jgi:hypothetical protein
LGAAPFLLPGSAGIDDGEYEVIVEETIRFIQGRADKHTLVHAC